MRRSHYIALAAMLLVVLSLSHSDDSLALSISPIKILNPGEGSIVTAPIEVVANLDLDDGDFIRLSLSENNQITYARKLHRTGNLRGGNFEYRTPLIFEIPRESTQALLSLAIKDQNNRFRAVRSVELTLISEGFSQINTPVNLEPWLVIDQPAANEKLKGGQVLVEGKVIPQTERPVFFDLVTESGRVIGTAQLAVESPFEPIEFESKIYYKISTQLDNVLLTVRQTNPEYGENIVLDSLSISLAP